MLPGGEIMLGLPASTELNKKQGRNIPKTKFFSNIDLTGAQERLFVDMVILKVITYTCRL